jgi:hypothetical protein
MWYIEYVQNSGWTVTTTPVKNLTRGEWKTQETAQAWADHFNSRKY